MYDWVLVFFVPVGLVYEEAKNPYTSSFPPVIENPCNNLQVIS